MQKHLFTKHSVWLATLAGLVCAQSHAESVEHVQVIGHAQNLGSKLALDSELSQSPDLRDNVLSVWSACEAELGS